MSTLPAFDTQRLLPYIALLANTALVVLIGLTAAQLFWVLWPVQAEPIPATALEEAGHAGAGITIDVDRITAAHLFGKRSESGNEASGIDAPETQLDLTLTGIVADDNGESSWALILQGDAEQHAYTTGDAVAEGVKVHAIHWNRVILERHGRFETLTLAIDKEAGVRVATEEDVLDASEQLAKFREEVAAEPALLSKYVTVRVAKGDGKIQGLRIFPTNESREVFEAAGIKPGEIVTMVNGIPLDERPDIAFLTTELRNARQFTISLEGRGRKRTVTISLD